MLEMEVKITFISSRVYIYIYIYKDDCVFFSFIKGSPTSTKFSMMAEDLPGNNWVVTAIES